MSIKLINKAIGFKRQTSAESKNMLTLVPTDKIRRLKMFIIGNRISLRWKRNTAFWNYLKFSE